MKTSLILTAKHHADIKKHLFPGDGKESVALALCGRYVGADSHKLLVHEVIPVPYDHCYLRTSNQVSWSTDILIPLLEKAAKYGMAIVKIHGHPQNYPHHSEVDDEADSRLFPSIYGWMDNDYPHASAIMLPNGRIFWRIVSPRGRFEPVSVVKVIGDDFHFYYADDNLETIPEFAQRTVQAFGEGTFTKLKRLKVGVVGCSGTGTWVIQQLALYGIGTLVLVDPDHIEEKNRNRIPATTQDVQQQTLKVDLAKHQVENMGLGTKVITFPKNLFNPEVVKAIADCDVVFGCMDSIDGRWLLNRLATFYLLPYFDLGVKLVADGKGGIEEICGGVQYLQPGGSSLWSRGMFSLEQVRAAGLKRTDPLRYQEEQQSKYIVGLPPDERPAVVSVNMNIASNAVLELLARLHPYRDEPNSEYASYMISFNQGRICSDREKEPCPTLAKNVGRGDVVPLLDNPELSEMEARV
jgi:ThiF family